MLEIPRRVWYDKNVPGGKEASGLTTRQVAQRSGIAEPTLEKLFAGATKDPKLETMRQLVHFFGHTLDDLEPPRPHPAKAAAPAPVEDECDRLAREIRALLIESF